MQQVLSYSVCFEGFLFQTRAGLPWAKMEMIVSEVQFHTPPLPTVSIF